MAAASFGFASKTSQVLLHRRSRASPCDTTKIEGNQRNTKPKRKGQFDVPLVIVIEVILIVAGLFVILQMVRMWAPGHRQIAFSNAELLRTAIDDVCANGIAKTIDFDFPQPVPLTFGYLGMGPLPKMMIKTNGDPNYLLYYENFPPGEGYEWEVYMSLPQRSVDFLLNKSQRDYTSTVPYVTANIVLGNNENFGNWTDDFFKFSTYALLPDLNKSMIKYRTCGADALCLKTKDGIYRLPLPSCKGTIEGIQLYMNGIGILGLATDEDEQFDFYLASPCSLKNLKIEKTTCGCGQWGSAAEDDTRHLAKPTNVLSVPVFAKEGNTLTQLSETKRCFHRIGESEKDNAEESGFPCIRITIDNRKLGSDFCFSSNDVTTWTKDIDAITQTSAVGERSWIWWVTLAGNIPGKERILFTSKLLEWLGSGGTLSWAWPSDMAFE
jgi:hypothetical protein